MEFIPFPKLARLSREIVITEKIDGTNASVHFLPIVSIDDATQALDVTYFDGVPHALYVGSRTRWIRPGDDNAAFALWVSENKEELRKLGPGSHFGEWWGKGIQRNYSKTDRTFSLFNTARWGDPLVRPACCEIVPVLFEGPLEEHNVLLGVKGAMKQLREFGSMAAPGFMKPEGIVVFHKAANLCFKKTLEKDESPKGAQ